VPDVKLYFCQGWYWLAIGEQYLHDVLNGTLSPQLTLEIEDCDSFSTVEAAWENPRPDAMPWQIHPGIGDHYRRTRCGGSKRGGTSGGKRLRVLRDLPPRGPR
jgi:hypothetical protein